MASPKTMQVVDKHGHAVMKITGWLYGTSVLVGPTIKRQLKAGYIKIGKTSVYHYPSGLVIVCGHHDEIAVHKLAQALASVSIPSRIETRVCNVISMANGWATRLLRVAGSERDSILDAVKDAVHTASDNSGVPVVWRGERNRFVVGRLEEPEPVERLGNYNPAYRR